MVVVGLVGGWGSVVQAGVEPVVVVPADPCGGGPGDGGAVVPGSGRVDDLGLVQPDGRLHEGVIHSVADGADRPGDP